MGFFTSVFFNRKRRARRRVRLRAAQLTYARRPRTYMSRRFLFDRNRQSLVKRKNRRHVNLRASARHGRYRTARAPVPTQKLRH